MAGGYFHCVDENGLLLEPDLLSDSIENLGDAYEAIEELCYMIWYLANGDTKKIEQAQEAVVKIAVDSWKSKRS